MQETPNGECDDEATPDHTERIEDLLEKVRLGEVLEPATEQALRKHLKECQECREQLEAEIMIWDKKINTNLFDKFGEQCRNKLCDDLKAQGKDTDFLFRPKRKSSQEWIDRLKRLLEDNPVSEER